MTDYPRYASLRRSLAAWLWLTTLVVWSLAAPARSEIAAGEAVRLYGEGRGLTARAGLVALLEGPDMREPAARLPVLQTLLDICIHSRADACVARYGPDYAEAAGKALPEAPVLAAEQARRAAYYFDAARLALHRPEVTAQILDWAPWTNENPANGELYLERRLLAARVLIAQGRPAAALAELDRVLSMVAGLSNPQDARFTLASSLAEAIAMLAELGQTERASGLLTAAGAFIDAALPARSVDAAAFRLNAAELRLDLGDTEGALKILAAARSGLEGVELDADVRARLLGRAVRLQALGLALSGDIAGAEAALGAHPLAGRFVSEAARAATPEEVAYLAVRALVGAMAGRTDPAAAAALTDAPGADAEETAIMRAGGRALALTPGDARDAAVSALRSRMAAWASGLGQAPGRRTRANAVERALTAVALSPAGTAGEPDAPSTFLLFQLAARAGRTFDADALAALSQAPDDLTRRAAHEALRLRARRDRLERTLIADVARRAEAPPTRALSLGHDSGVRIRLGEYARRIDAAQTALAAGGIRLDAAPIVPLDRFQAVLAPGEAALAIAPAAGGTAYLCVRRDRVTQARRVVDLAQVRLDVRLLQAALSATYPPSETLDAQFPAQAAARLYDVLLRPLESCLEPGDRILWLPGLAQLSGVPLSVLLPTLPPRLGPGYDLARADWVVRHHAVSYAGSAAVVLAARSAGAARPQPPFDFLGVGDPVLSGAAGPHGAELAALPPLPETKVELAASAAGFGSAKVLTGGAATERAFRSELAGAYRYLSFATHGLMRGELSGLTEPALVLTPGGGDAGDDGLLTASEIADLNLAAAFVALSACNTANLDLRAAAEDLPALASAFAVAGPPATLATLWPVNSQAGKQVVGDTFARLGKAPQDGSAEALADAQRALLAAPPGRAWLHPRFWAPFVVLGDGGARGPARASGLSLTAVEPMADGPGEGLTVRRTGAGVAARYLGGPAGAGQRMVGLRMADAAGAELWRNEAAAPGASVFLGELRGTIVTGGAERGPDGRLAPHLAFVDARTGATAGTWTAPASGAAVAGALNGADAGRGRTFVVTGDIRPRDGRPPAARVYELAAGASPRLLFETSAGSIGLDAASVAPLGSDVLVTLTDRHAQPAQAPGAPADDYDAPACLWETLTRIELRDGRNGALKASREIRGLDVTAALSRGGTALLAGAETPACGEERRAVVLRIGPDLQPETLYRDESLGESWAWSLSAMPGGRAFVAASKRAVVDVRPVAASPEAAVAAVAGLPTGTSGMALVLDAHGVASGPRMLEAGADVFVNGADAGRPDDILLAGGLGGRPVIFHLHAAER